MVQSLITKIAGLDSIGNSNVKLLITIIMDLQIIKVADNGDLEKERVIIKVLKDCLISWYLIFDNTYNEDGTLSNLWRHLYIFPKRRVNAGDYIWLYTKDGNGTQWRNDSNTTTHVLYWGLGETIWNHDEDRAYLVKYEDSQTFEVCKQK